MHGNRRANATFLVMQGSRVCYVCSALLCGPNRPEMKRLAWVGGSCSLGALRPLIYSSVVRYRRWALSGHAL